VVGQQGNSLLLGDWKSSPLPHDSFVISAILMHRSLGLTQTFGIIVFTATTKFQTRLLTCGKYLMILVNRRLMTRVWVISGKMY